MRNPLKLTFPSNDRAVSKLFFTGILIGCAYIFTRSVHGVTFWGYVVLVIIASGVLLFLARFNKDILPQTDFYIDYDGINSFQRYLFFKVSPRHFPWEQVKSVDIEIHPAWGRWSATYTLYLVLYGNDRIDLMAEDDEANIQNMKAKIVELKNNLPTTTII